MALIFCLNEENKKNKTQFYFITQSLGVLLNSEHLLLSLTLHTHRPGSAPDLITKSHTDTNSANTAKWVHTLNEHVLVNLPAITVLFPSSTTRGSRDRDESITFPSISFPWDTQWDTSDRDTKTHRLCFASITLLCVQSWNDIEWNVWAAGLGYLHCLNVFKTQELILNRAHPLLSLWCCANTLWSKLF